MQQTFCYEKKTDEGVCLSLKLRDKVRVHEIYVESEAKSPDVLIWNIDQLNNVSGAEMNEVISLSQLK